MDNDYSTSNLTIHEYVIQFDKWKYDILALMRQYPAKSKKRKKTIVKNDRFDKSILTATDHELLEAFKARRNKSEELIEKSNIIHGKSVCPGCGFPTITEPDNYETCIICLWEDDGRDDKSDSSIHLPNSLSLVQHRINIAIYLKDFENRHSISNSIDEIIREIKSFEEKVSNGLIEPVLDFETNLKMIFTSKRRQQ